MSARFELELKKRIDEEIERLRNDLEAGTAVKDYAQYREYVGKLASLRRTSGEFIEDVQTTINKG